MPPSLVDRVTPISTTKIIADNGLVTCMHITSQNNILLAFNSGALHVFDCDGKNERLVTYMGGNNEKGQAIWALDSWEKNYIICGGVGLSLAVWNMDTLEKIAVLKGHVNTVRSVKALSPSLAVSGSRDSTLRIWNITTGMCETVLEGHKATVRAVAVSGDVLVSGSYDHNARIWSLEKRKCMHILKGHQLSILEVATDGKVIVTGSIDKTARIWDITSGTCLAVLPGQGVMSLIQIIPSIILTADGRGGIQVWSLENHSKIREIEAQENGHSAIICMDCDGSQIVTTDNRGYLKLWDVEDINLIRELTKANVIWKCAFLRDSRRVVVVSGNYERPNSEELALEIWDSSNLYG